MSDSFPTDVQLITKLRPTGPGGHQLSSVFCPMGRCLLGRGGVLSLFPLLETEWIQCPAVTDNCAGSAE